ncbi:CTP synthase [Candidatus Phytoplasma phoenicium]|uniref:CTP synthase n=1 Tax=Candidatus Phytoplasma phoenicium TaxID=198422 RepID=A0A0L0MJJ1_9MOLU|nr:CTP synthase [Candidatus Phytoplasma phoenicium]KND62513.1 CTP synthase [Candidatus Phytoplasma phoenicium]
MNNHKVKNKKFIFITGGVVSGLGKGIIAATIGRILKQRGLKIFMQKFDPYINVDSGTMNPFQHGEVFVTDDGAETDLDLGHYERFLDENLLRESNVTTGQIYQSVIQKERQGEYLGKTIQVIPHITNEIKNKILNIANITDCDVIIVEIGGTVGDIESLPFLEAIRQMRYNIGFDNTLYIHNTLIPYLKTSNEIKTKPTQHSIKELRSLGIQPQILILRSEKNISREIKEKIAILCDVKKNAIFENIDTDILYKIIVNLHQQKIDDFILDHFKLQPMPVSDISQYTALIHKIKNLKKQITIGFVCKYFTCNDAYLSTIEALKHAAYYNNVNVNIKWIDSETLTAENVMSKLQDFNGILVPGGFGSRGIEGKIQAIKYARENNIPFFGICLGLQMAVIEYTRNVLNLKEAHSEEMEPNTSVPVITRKIKNRNLGGTLRLGLHLCQITTESKSYQIFQNNMIYERHRQRYEVNPEYIPLLTKDNNFIVAGINPEEQLTEIIELKNHIWFIAVQFHPEFLSRPFKPHPLFKDFIRAVIAYKTN